MVRFYSVVSGVHRNRKDQPSQRTDGSGARGRVCSFDELREFRNRFRDLPLYDEPGEPNMSNNILLIIVVVFIVLVVLGFVTVNVR